MIQHSEFASRKLAEDAVAIGKKYCATAYPNPTRTGCPNGSTLKAMAKRHIALPEMPISHVVSCSPCFNEYLRYRRAAVVFTRLQLAAAVVLIATIAFATSRFVNIGRFGHDHITTAKKSDSAPPQKTGAAEASNAEPVAQIEVNLALFSTTRGVTSQQLPKQIHLPAKALHVVFLLPTGMEPGDYAVRLRDPAGAAKVDRRVKVTVSGGVASFAMDLHFDASDIGGGWRLMIREPGLSWRSYPVAIG